jgi:V/A-type H+-transporting ATPase subunit F
LKVVAIGSRIFITSFQLAGIFGIQINSPSEALEQIKRNSVNDEIGLILLSDDVGKEIRSQLTDIRSKRPIPLIFELPSPGSSKQKIDYRAVLKQILGLQ